MNRENELTFGDVEEILIRETNLASRRLEAIAPVEDYKILKEPYLSVETKKVRNFQVKMGNPISIKARVKPFEETCRINNGAERFTDYLPVTFEGFSTGDLKASRFCWGLPFGKLVRNMETSLQNFEESYRVKLYDSQGKEIPSTKENFCKDFNSEGFAVACARSVDSFFESTRGYYPRAYGAIFNFRGKKGSITLSEDRPVLVAGLKKFEPGSYTGGWCSD